MANNNRAAIWPIAATNIEHLKIWNFDTLKLRTLELWNWSISHEKNLPTTFRLPGLPKSSLVNGFGSSANTDELSAVIWEPQTNFNTFWYFPSGSIFGGRIPYISQRRRTSKSNSQRLGIANLRETNVQLCSNLPLCPYTMHSSRSHTEWGYWREHPLQSHAACPNRDTCRIHCSTSRSCLCHPRAISSSYPSSPTKRVGQTTQFLC